MGLFAALAACRESGSRGVTAAAGTGADSAQVRAMAPSAEPSGASPAAGRAAATPLVLGATREGRFAGADAAAYALPLRRGDYAHVVVEQRGVDVALDLFAPGGRPLLVLDSPNSTRGPEHLFVLAEEHGGHRLEVRPFSPVPGGSFTVTLAALRRPAEGDRSRAAACRAVSEGDAALAAEEPGGPTRAERLYERALALWRASGDSYSALIARIKLAQALSDGGEKRSAAAVWEEALRESERLGLTVEAVVAGNGSGLARKDLGEPDRARAAFEAALSAAHRLGDLREETVALNNLALLEKETGESLSAILLYDRVLGNFRALGNLDDEATALHNIGALYTVLGRLPEAREALENALRLRRAGPSRVKEASTLLALGWVRCREGDFRRCRRDLERSLALRRSIGDRRGEAVALDRLGSALREAGDAAAAVREYEKALAILETLEAPGGSAGATLSNLGETLVRSGDAAAGLLRLDAAVPLLDRFADPSTAGYAYARRARAKRALGRLRDARADAEAALERLETFREDAGSGALSESFLDSAYEHYELALELAMEQHRMEPAAGHDRAGLEIAERARARGLLALLDGARQSGSLAAALARDADLRRIEAEIRSRGASSGPDERLRRLLLERGLLLAGLRRAGRPEPESAPVLDAAAIRERVLDDETVLLVYALGEPRSYVWAVTRETVASAALPPRITIEAAVERFHRLLAAPPRRGTSIQARLVAAEVSRLLLGPIARHLGDRRLAVAAEGAVARLPFAALPDPRGGGEPLVERHEIVTVPSASVLDAIRRRAAARAPARRLLAVLANPVFARAAAGADPATARGGDQPAPHAPPASGSLAALTRSVKELGLEDIRPVPFTAREAAAIAAFAPREELLRALGPAATRELVVGGGLGDFRIVHFATHALIHPEHPELSGIVLSLYDRDGRPVDGFLRSYEIARLDLPADLVVLAACRTGDGKEVRGEGLVGLTQSFFQAGAASVVASIWEVDDEATARLMAGFYRELLGRGRTPAAALRAAQRALLAEPRWSAPAHWAGFVVAGEWRPGQQAAGKRVSLDSRLPRIPPEAVPEESTMGEKKTTVATRSGSTPGQDTGTKGDKGLESDPLRSLADSDGGSEPGEDDTVKGTKGV